MKARRTQQKKRIVYNHMHMPTGGQTPLEEQAKAVVITSLENQTLGQVRVKPEGHRKQMSLLHSNNALKKSNNTSVFDGGSQYTPSVYGNHFNREKDNASKLNTDLLAVSMVGVPSGKPVRQVAQT